MSITGGTGITGNTWPGFQESLKGPAEDHPNRQRPAPEPLYVQLKKKAAAVTLPNPLVAPANHE